MRSKLAEMAPARVARRQMVRQMVKNDNIEFTLWQFRVQTVATAMNTTHSLIRTLPMLSHRQWLKIQGISVAHFSKQLSSLRHVLVRCAFHSFPSCRFISYLFSVTTFSVDNITGEEQIKPLAPLLTGVECLAAWPIQLQTHATGREINRRVRQGPDYLHVHANRRFYATGSTCPCYRPWKKSPNAPKSRLSTCSSRSP